MSETEELRSLSWQSLLLMGLTNSQVKGAIIVSWRVTNAVVVAWIVGWLAPLGFPGPAGAEEVEIVKQEARAARIEFLESRIFEVRVQQCEAAAQEKSQVAYTVQLTELMKKYRELTQRNAEVPQCKELL